MENKEIQEQRIRGYFIQAAKETLKGEGLKTLNVRNVADRAGYSYATLYNYFRDLKDLVFECVRDFQEECEAFVRSETAAAPHGIEGVRAKAKAYAKYFVQYPGIFELFFIERISDVGSKRPTLELIFRSLDRACTDEWNYCISKNIASADEAERMSAAMRYSLAGLLLFYINRRHPESYQQFIMALDTQLENVLGPHNGPITG